MSRLIKRKPSGGTIYPLHVPGHVRPRRTGRDTPATLYFTIEQLTELRAQVAEAIFKTRKHRMEEGT